MVLRGNVFQSHPLKVLQQFVTARKRFGYWVTENTRSSVLFVEGIELFGNPDLRSEAVLLLRLLLTKRAAC